MRGRTGRGQARERQAQGRRPRQGEVKREPVLHAPAATSQPVGYGGPEVDPSGIREQPSRAVVRAPYGPCAKPLRWRTSAPASVALLMGCAASAVPSTPREERAPIAPSHLSPVGVNVALGMKYQLAPAPNYAYCTDDADSTQLTDGQYVEGYFWVQKGAVGWQGASPAITIDLGAIQPISGLSYNTAGGTAGATFPTGIFILVSDDGERWHQEGDLVALSTSERQPPRSGYAVHRYRTMDLRTRGRFVKLLVIPGGPCTFVDEIEVYRGPDDLLTAPAAGRQVGDLKKFFERASIEAPIRRRLRNDLAEVARGLPSGTRGQAASLTLATELAAVAQAIPALDVGPLDMLTTVFPLNEVHRRIFALQAGAWRVAGLAGVIEWPANRWDVLSPTATPAPTPSVAAVDVDMMNNEYRSAAFNLSNAGDTDATVTISIEGLTGGSNPAYVAVHEVPFTDTVSGVAVAAALPLARRDKLATAVSGGERGPYFVRIPPGLTRQIWLTFHPVGLPAGKQDGKIDVQGDGRSLAEVPVRLKVYSSTFPSHPALNLGGWDYTDRAHIYGVTPENRAALIALLREHFVNTPWATSAVLALGQYDKNGRMVVPPEPSAFRAWLDRWPNARNYFVAVDAGESFAGFSLGTPAFKQAVGDWITWWAKQLARWHIRPDQLGLALVDEPKTPAQDHIVVAYAEVIRGAQPQVVIWEDPLWTDPSAAARRMFDLTTVLSPSLPMWLSGGQAFDNFYLEQRRSGRRLWFYSCRGPARLLDPYGYYRLQEWFAWKFAAEGSEFWAFSDTNGGSSWNEYATQMGGYTPLFLDPTSVTTSKQMEALREGIEDYEYLRMLRDRVRDLDSAGVKTEAIRSARRLLDTAADRVIAEATPGGLWSDRRDRTPADQVRVEILEALARLQAQ